MTEKASEDDVFEFLESLPEAKVADKGDKDKSGKKGNEDIMDFLDELEKSNLSVSKESGNSKKTSPAHVEGTKERDTSEATSAIKTTEIQTHKDIEEPAEPKKSKVLENQDNTVQANQPSHAGEEEAPREDTSQESREETPLNDPITSLSNWWTSSGSATVSNIWSKTTEQASQIKTRLAQEQLDLTSRLNSNAITELAKNLQKFVVGETEEVLRIHLVHDLINFPFLQSIVDQKFDQVFSSQVQGGIRVFSDQWGHPHKIENDTQSYFSSQQPKLNIFSGKITDGEKLAFANLENAIKLFQKAHEEYMKQKEGNSKAVEEEKKLPDDEEDQDDRISDIFISILPVAIPSKQEDTNEIVTIDPHQPGNFSFTIILKDITNDISTITRSQGFPLKWVGWLEGDSEWKTKLKKEQEERTQEEKSQEDDEVDVDPSDWVRDWVEDGLNVAFGVVAQNYVIERMGF
ncbi:related to Maintenance of telomere capping protein 1 [Zygosaccharomyces bailii]|nr:related to Maintenance of telomere capping protein 1 [Zygosaccharomyces bailii]